MNTIRLIFSVVLAGLSVASWPQSARAHHPRPTARPSLPTAALGFGVPTAGGSTLELRIGAEVSYFDRLRQDDLTADGDAALLVGTLVPAVRWALSTGTEVRGRLPVGFVRRSASGGPSDTAFGLGDVSLTVAQELLGFGARDRVSLRITVGLVLPTGLYRSDASVSFVDILTGPEGALDVVTYNTQATLGAGTWSATLGLELAWRLSSRLWLGARGRWSEPLTSTSDGILWGRDIESMLGLTVVPWLDALTVAVGVDYRRHALDAVPDDTGRRLDIGGRDELGVVAMFEAGLSDDLRCSGGAHIPAWQRVGGVQLVETVSVRVSCGYRFGL